MNTEIPLHTPSGVYKHGGADEVATATAAANAIIKANSSAKLDPNWIASQMTVTSDSAGLKLVNDTTSPGPNKTYGTDASGVRGWKSDPAGSGGVSDGDKGGVTVSASGTVWTVKQQMSIIVDASGLKLDGDSSAPGASKIYGTDSGGTKGWKTDNSIATATPANARIPLSNASAKLDPGWIASQMSVTNDSAGLKLVSDETTPGASKVYGTDSGGSKGWKTDNSIGTATPTASRIPLSNASAKLDPGWLALQMSVTSDAAGVKLSGDSTSPGNDKVYGTDGSGVKGWKNHSPLTTQGDLLSRGASADQRLAIGSRGKTLLSDGTDPYWAIDDGFVFGQNRTGIFWTVGATSATFSTQGDQVSVSGTPSNSNVSSTQPAMIANTTGAVAGNAASHYGLTMTAPRQQPKVFAIILVPDSSSSRIWVSLHDGTSTTGTNSDTPTSRSLMGFRYSTDAADPNWMCCTNDGTGPLNVIDSGVAITGNVTVLAMDHTGSSVKFYINGSLVATSSSSLPSANVACRLQLYIETRTAAARTIRSHAAGIIKNF